MEKTIKEKFIQNGISPVSLEATEKIIYQMKKCVCKIYINGETGTGFFTKIPYKNNFLKVLITNNHIVGENEIKNNKKLTISLNNEKDKKFIQISNNRKRYTNEILDVTIIEIDENKDDIHDYIELDKEIINSIKLKKKEIINNYKDIYKNQSIYILNYLKGENTLVSYGFLSEINNENGINHICNTDYGSYGSPILSLKNNKLIGIHYGSSKFEFNKGTLIIYPIIEFQNIKNNIYIINKEKNIKLNELTIIYDIKDQEGIYLFGYDFVHKNKNNCKIIIEDKEQDIFEYLTLNKKMKDQENLQIKLKEIKPITNMSWIFGTEESPPCPVLSLPDLDKWDTKNVIDMSFMFSLCKIKSLPDISKWDTRNVTTFEGMFFYCSSLSSLPDISKWDTRKVTNISTMFYNCSLLSSLPDISKWDTREVTEMKGMLYGCSSLSSLPDVSKWNNKKVSNIDEIFEN